MATGTVKYAALMTPHQEIYNGRSAKTWKVTQTGSFPAKDYKVVKAVINYDIRNVYASNRHMKVYRRDGDTDIELGDVTTGSGGKHSESLSTSVSYAGIHTIKLDGVERWACQLRGGSYVEIIVTWEETAPVVVSPSSALPSYVVTGSEKNNGVRDAATNTSVSVSIEGVDISEVVNQYLLSMSYTDNEEDEADDLQIKLQDSDGQWLQKWLNDILQAAAGTKATTKGLTIKAGITLHEPSGRIRRLNCGSFELDRIEASGPPSTVTIKGTSLPYGNGVRTEERDKAWEGYTISNIGREIAQKAGLGFLYDAPKDPCYSRIEQAKQTDIAFLQNICHKNGLSLKVSGQKLIIFDQARYEAMVEVSTIQWMDGTYTRYNLSTQEGDVHYARCTVRYYHPEQKKMIEGSAMADDAHPDDEDQLTLIVTNERVNSAAEAQELAAKLLRLHNKYEKKCSFTLIGNPMLGAGLTASLKGFGLWSTRYIIEQCRHEVGTGGYTTRITLRTIPDKNVEKGAIGSEAIGSSSGGGSRNENNHTAKTWKTIKACTVYKTATGNTSVGSLAAGVPVTLLGSTRDGRTYISGGGKTGYVPSGCIGKV